MRRWLSSVLLLACLTGVSAEAEAAAGKPKVHVVYQGQTLGLIAKRYNVSIEALCTANGIQRRDPIKPGQKLVVPSPDDKSGKLARRAKQTTVKPASARASTAAVTTASRTSTWKKYARPARRAGYVVLKATGRQWQGYAIVKGNKLSGPGRQAFRRVMYSWRTGAEADIHPRLMRLLVQVSDTFGGRPLKIASGFREHSFARESKHKTGQACDFSVEGVPNEALRDYLLTLDRVGVGYYPNSSFVHLDVRTKSNQWVDRAGPGARPQYDHHARRR